MKINLLLLLSISLFNFTYAGDEKNYSELTQETNDYTIEVTDIISEGDFSKLKVKITNKTGHYIYFDGSKCTFKYDFGEFKPSERPTRIDPYKSDSKVLDVKDEQGRLNTDKFILIIDGLTIVPSYGQKFEVEEFKLPPVFNDVDAGPFKISLKNYKKKTDNTAAKFEVQYIGRDIALIDPGKVGVRLEDGQQFANAKHDYNLQILRSGDKDNFTVYFDIDAKVADMQFADMWILWRSTFQEAREDKLDGVEFEITAQ